MKEMSGIMEELEKENTLIENVDEVVTPIPQEANILTSQPTIEVPTLRDSGHKTIDDTSNTKSCESVV
jgi:hypothetical protein